MGEVLQNGNGRPGAPPPGDRKGPCRFPSAFWLVLVMNASCVIQRTGAPVSCRATTKKWCEVSLALALALPSHSRHRWCLYCMCNHLWPCHYVLRDTRMGWPFHRTASAQAHRPVYSHERPEVTPPTAVTKPPKLNVHYTTEIKNKIKCPGTICPSCGKSTPSPG